MATQKSTTSFDASASPDPLFTLQDQFRDATHRAQELLASLLVFQHAVSCDEGILMDGDFPPFADALAQQAMQLKTALAVVQATLDTLRGKEARHV